MSTFIVPDEPLMSMPNSLFLPDQPQFVHPLYSCEDATVILHSYLNLGGFFSDTIILLLTPSAIPIIYSWTAV
jgi:hypothetical protein